MKKRLKYFELTWFRHDLPAGLSVFFVALPLCLGIALACGTPLYSGLMSGVIGGILVSLLSGSHLAVSGPAAGLTPLVAATISSCGSFELFLLSVVVAGLFQVLLGLVRLGTIAHYFPSSVLKGMLAAIGIILISKQIPLMIGYKHPDFWTSGFLKSILKDSYEHLYKEFSPGSVFIFAACLILMASPYNLIAKKIRPIPLPLIIVGLGILLNYSFRMLSPGLAIQPEQLVFIPPDVFSFITFPDLAPLVSRMDIWTNGLIIGLLASLETLLCIEAVDKLDPRNRITPVNRELFAQGIGNIACGLLGAIPITAVVVRGAANIDAGAKTKLSAFTHGLFLLIAIVLIPSLLNKIPYACLSAILLYTGYNLTKPKIFKSMWGLGWKQFLPFLITILVILSTDLLIGVSIGLLISVFFIVQNNFRAEYRISKTKSEGIEKYFIRLNTNVTFLNKVSLKRSLDEVPKYSVLTIDGSGCNFIDYDILEIISEFHSKAKEKHIEVHLLGINSVEVASAHY